MTQWLRVFNLTGVCIEKYHLGDGIVIYYNRMSNCFLIFYFEGDTIPGFSQWYKDRKPKNPRLSCWYLVRNDSILDTVMQSHNDPYTTLIDNGDLMCGVEYIF